MHLQESKLVIYGASGHGKVVADIAEKSGLTILAFADDNQALENRSFCGYPVWGGSSHLIRHAWQEKFSVIIAIGDNRLRREVQQKLEPAGLDFGTVIHPSAQLGREVLIGAGTVVMANSVINPGARVGCHCIVNTAVTIDHDCVIGDFVHLSPGAHLGGTVEVGDFSWIGLGASIINNIHVGEQVVVGAGAVVIRNVESQVTVVGNPAAFLRTGKNKELK
jgi:sugar O-acyltransferase (sialic acid O-acetyltransferase NeuD family)